MTKNRLSFAGSQTLLASDNEFNSTGNFNSTETVEGARRLTNVYYTVMHSCILLVSRGLESLQTI